MAVEFNIRHLDENELHLDGELSPEELDLEIQDPLVQARKPLQYDINVQKTGSDILAQGRLELPLQCECSRCLKPFKTKVLIEDWAALLPLQGEEAVPIENDMVDLTPFVREDILLNFPQHPLCSEECAGLPAPPEKKSQTQGSSAWSELNKLKL
ncbi:MAG: YceD family protein [Limisphaerales bacterium]